MIKVPTIKGSAQARLLLYQLITSKIMSTERKFLEASRNFWEQLISEIDKLLVVNAQSKVDEKMLMQIFGHIDSNTRKGLQMQMQRLTGKTFWLGVHSMSLLNDFVQEHKSLLKSVQQQHT